MVGAGLQKSQEAAHPYYYRPPKWPLNFCFLLFFKVVWVFQITFWFPVVCPATEALLTSSLLLSLNFSIYDWRHDECSLAQYKCLVFNLLFRILGILVMLTACITYSTGYILLGVVTLTYYFSTTQARMDLCVYVYLCVCVCVQRQNESESN